METRRMIVALVACFAFFFLYQLFYNKYFPPPKLSPTSPATALQAPDPAAPTLTGTQPAATRAESGEHYSFTTGGEGESISLGQPGDPLTVEFATQGGAISTILLTEKKKNGQYVHRRDATSNEPFTLLAPVQDGDRTLRSYVTNSILVTELGVSPQLLDNIVWETVAHDARSIAFSTTLKSSTNAQGLLRISKSYRLTADKPQIGLSVQLDNLSQQPLTVVLTQDGPAGIPADNPRQNMRRVFGAYRYADGSFHLEYIQRDPLAGKGGFKSLLPSEAKAQFVWTALADKYFAIFTRPIAVDGPPAAAYADVQAVVGVPTLPHDSGDLVARLVTLPTHIAPGASVRESFEITATPKDAEMLAGIDPAFTSAAGPNFVAVKSVDHSCCTFEPLPKIMTWLLETVYVFVRNYGLAIVGLVLIVRSLLHPMAVFQQKSMYRMQESMARIQPKLQAVKEKYANDKVRLNQEMMKVYADENVNPMASFVGMIPLFIQMPILVALWTALNDDIHLRNAPFDGWWIKDLSQPDSLIHFGTGGLTIPVLSMLPLIGWMFTNISSLNLLPILMGVSMFLQQKYMPKPAMAAKLEAAKNQPKKADGLSPEDQLRQQQMMANMMSVVFPFMFYYMPSGLNLYWMATNVFGIFESLIIRKQISREKLAGPKAVKPKKPGLMSKMFRMMAEQAEAVQSKADELGGQKKKRDDDDDARQTPPKRKR